MPLEKSSSRRILFFSRAESRAGIATTLTVTFVGTAARLFTPKPKRTMLNHRVFVIFFEYPKHNTNVSGLPGNILESAAGTRYLLYKIFRNHVTPVISSPPLIGWLGVFLTGERRKPPQAVPANCAVHEHRDRFSEKCLRQKPIIKRGC